MKFIETLLIILGALGITGIVGKLLYNKIQKWIVERETKTNFNKAVNMMPFLLNEMKEELGQTNWQCYEFVILREFETINLRTVVLRFSESKHKYLFANLRILEGFGFVREITFNNTPRYQFELLFIELLKKWNPKV